jgi:predicted anti-sigma-YlaC factor YlaD
MRLVSLTSTAIAVHLDQCPDCKEWFDTLVGLAREGEGP